MNFRLVGKKIAERMPRSISHFFVYVPFSLRLGSAYNCSQNQIDLHERMSTEEKKIWIFDHLQDIVSFAYNKNLAYRTIYQRAGFNPDKLKSIAYFQDVPVVRKSDLREFSLEERSSKQRGRLLLNTGGSSGCPLEFFVDSQAFAREWAHMHWIWRRRGYRQCDTKLTLRGKNLGSNLFRYNVVHNEFILNAYADKKDVADVLIKILKNKNIQWVHGYPSLVADFLNDIEGIDYIKEYFKKNMKGALLGSEFPAPHYRKIIERAIGENIVAWYGHSEMCVLAFEATVNNYNTMQSYGFCESYIGGDGKSHLVGTSYWNNAGPFIRYDTEDCIDPSVENGLLTSFAVVEGRTGDFVLDKRSNRIALTALIFGRHHKAFENIKHIQVVQIKPGEIEILVVLRKADIPLEQLKKGFDFTNVGLDVSYRIVEKQFSTQLGKTPLLIRPEAFPAE